MKPISGNLFLKPSNVPDGTWQGRLPVLSYRSIVPRGTKFESNRSYTNDHELTPDDMSREPTSDSFQGARRKLKHSSVPGASVFHFKGITFGSELILIPRCITGALEVLCYGVLSALGFGKFSCGCLQPKKPENQPLKRG